MFYRLNGLNTGYSMLKIMQKEHAHDTVLIFRVAGLAKLY